MPLSKQEFIAGRISHYLVGYRRRNNLTQGDLAKQLKVTKSSVCRFERTEQNSIVNSLETICTLASLEQQSLVQFISYLLKEELPVASGTQAPWQESVLKAVGGLDQLLRLKICAELLPRFMNDRKHLSLLFECFLLMGQLQESELNTVKSLLEVIGNQK